MTLFPKTMAPNLITLSVSDDPLPPHSAEPASSAGVQNRVPSPSGPKSHGPGSTDTVCCVLQGLCCVLVNFGMLLYYNPTLACGTKPLHVSYGGPWDPLFAPASAVKSGWLSWLPKIGHGKQPRTSYTAPVRGSNRRSDGGGPPVASPVNESRC